MVDCSIKSVEDYHTSSSTTFALMKVREAKYCTRSSLANSSETNTQLARNDLVSPPEVDE